MYKDGHVCTPDVKELTVYNSMPACTLYFKFTTFTMRKLGPTSQQPCNEVPSLEVPFCWCVKWWHLMCGILMGEY